MQKIATIIVSKMCGTISPNPKLNNEEGKKAEDFVHHLSNGTPKPLWDAVILLMAEILHQLRLVVYPIIYRVSYIPGGAGFQPSTVTLVGKHGSLLMHSKSP